MRNGSKQCQTFREDLEQIIFSGQLGYVDEWVKLRCLNQHSGPYEIQLSLM